MYINTLLAISIFTLVDCRTVWDIISNVLTSVASTMPEDAGLNIKQLADKYGYSLNEHTVTTEDGYIINFHRIYTRNKKPNGPIVFLMHGIMESSDSWVLQGPNYSFAYMLADRGFDVWLGNSRGNKHSMGHIFLNHTDSKYWQFTWEQIGLYDLPAMIDYIIKETGKESIYYIGYSQGTTTGFVLLSMKPEYNKKIKIMFALAPEAWMSNVKSRIIQFFSPTLNILESFLSYNLYSGIELYGKISSFLCQTQFQCENIMYGLSGYGSQINKDLIPIIMGHMPSGTSVQQFIHYGQLVSSRKFCRYDYGYEKNIFIYGQSEPPEYDLSKIFAPIILYYSDSDILSDPMDVDILKNHLPNVLASNFLNNFTHMDYMYSAAARDSIYIKIIELVRNFEKNGNM